MCGAQSTHLLEYMARLRTFKDAQTSITNVRTATAQSLGQTVEKVIRAEEKRLKGVCRSNPVVVTRLHERLKFEESHMRRLRQEYQDLMTH